MNGSNYGVGLGDWNKALELTGSAYRVPQQGGYEGAALRGNPYDEPAQATAPAPVNWKDYDQSAPAPLVQNPTSIKYDANAAPKQGGGGMDMQSMYNLGAGMAGGGGGGAPPVDQGQKNQQEAFAKIGNVLGLVGKFYSGDWMGMASQAKGMSDSGGQGGGQSSGGGGDMLKMFGGMFGGG